VSGLRFDFEKEKIKQEITRLGAKRVLLQMPQGLKPQATELAKIVEGTKALPILSIDPCYGSCDVALSEAQALGADLIVHFGHAKMLCQEPIPTLYIEAKANVDIGEALHQALPLLDAYQKIGLVTSIQHVDALNDAKELLETAGKVVLVGNSGQVRYAGQVTGCNYSNAKTIADQVDAFLFVGGGMFHALGVTLSTAKPTVIADPYDNRAYNVGEEAQRIVKQRFASIQQAKTAKIIGILISVKPGQKQVDHAVTAKMLAETYGLTAFLLAGHEVTPEGLMDFPNIDAYVNTACPRISLDTAGKFQKPVLTVNEFRVVCGEELWENLLKGGLFEN
jgi:2-(3-amino-3-carboxypropyl)histidine synthase